MSQAEQLVCWLNHSKGSAAYEHVYGLLTRLSGLDSLLREHPVYETEADGTSKYVGTSPGALLRDSINESLDAYIFRPTLSFTDADAAAVHWIPTSSTVHVPTAAEHTMVRLIVDLFNAGALSTIRQCEQCKQTWIVVMRGVDRFCNKACRENFYQSSPAYRQRKRVNQAGYRLRVKRLPFAKAASDCGGICGESYQKTRVNGGKTGKATSGLSE